MTGVENAPYNYTTANESQSFTWDPTNQIATATGTDATVTRGYHSSGALLGETQVLFTRSRTGTPHSYTLSYTYDANGRRTSLTVSPSTLFAGAPMTWSYTSWGALGSVSDIASNAYSYGYNGRGDLTSITYPGGVSETIGYDNAGRLATDQITRAGATTFPYPSSPTLRNFAATRNARGQILNGSDQANAGNGFPTSTYSGLGYLTTNQMTQTGYQFRSGLLGTFTSTDNVTSDGLGNILASSGGWGLPPTAVTTNTINTYNADGRLVQQVNTTGGTSRTTSTAFDAAGNTRFETTRPSGGSSVDEERASYYRGDERVVAIDRRVSGRRTLEEFRYDPLGRRVWVSTQTTCAPTSDITCLTSAVRRTVWDGDRELAELQAPVDPAAPATEELDANVPPLPFVALPGSTSYGDPNPFFGRVVYGPGLAPDQPMSVTRYEYRDNPGNTNPHVWPRLTLMVFWDYRGAPAYGLFTNGAWAAPFTLGTGQTNCPVVGLTSDQRCMLVQWPFAQSAYDKARGNIQFPSWQGSLLRNKQDGTGLEYHRNRLYDPKTGRFTQEDPIGLAGGLNLYGFANGDPVNFSDPFGLRPGNEGLTRDNASEAQQRGLGQLSQQGTPEKPKHHAIYLNKGSGRPSEPELAANVTLDDKPGVVATVRHSMVGSGPNSTRYQGELVFGGKVYAATLKVIRIGSYEFGDFVAVPKTRWLFGPQCRWSH